MNRRVTRFVAAVATAHVMASGLHILVESVKAHGRFSAPPPCDRGGIMNFGVVQTTFSWYHSPPEIFSQFFRQYFLAWYAYRTEGDQGPI